MKQETSPSRLTCSTHDKQAVCHLCGTHTRRKLVHSNIDPLQQMVRMDMPSPNATPTREWIGDGERSLHVNVKKQRSSFFQCVFVILSSTHMLSTCKYPQLERICTHGFRVHYRCGNIMLVFSESMAFFWSRLLTCSTQYQKFHKVERLRFSMNPLNIHHIHEEGNLSDSTSQYISYTLVVGLQQSPRSNNLTPTYEKIKRR